MHLTNYERETIISFNEGEDVASVHTHSRPLIRRLEKLAQERPEEVKHFKTSHEGQAVEYYVPKSWVKINPTRQLSEEQREAMAKRMKANLSRKTPIIIGDSAHATAAEGKTMS